jgi:hypothetical protein
MRAADVLGGAVRSAGVLDLEATEGGIVFHRMPPWARVQHNDLALALLETMPSGGRLEMVTDATALELDVHLTQLQLGDEPGPPAAFEVAIDDELVAAHETREGTLITVDVANGAIDIAPGEPTTVHFTDLSAGEKRVDLWLPHAAAVRLIELRADGNVAPPPPSGARRWVHYGSSISHCIEATRPTGVWPVVAARRAGVDLQSFAFAGQCHLDPFAGRMIAAQPAELVSVKLGINIVNGDTMRERTFVPAVHGLLDTIRDGHPDVPIILVTPITCPVVEDHPGPTSLVGGRCSVVARPPELAVGALTLQRIRDLEAEIVDARRVAGDHNLHLLPGPDLFGPHDVTDLHDGLHPNSDGYRRIGERFYALAFEEGPFR